MERARVLAGSSMLALALCARAAPSAAQASRVQIELEYRAPAECPDRAQLEARIRARSERVVITSTSTAERTFDVSIEPSWRARVQVRDRSRETSSREVSGETCREVVEAAALIIAVLADPQAATEPAPPAEAAPTPVPELVVAEPQPAPRAASREPWPWRFALGIGLTLETAPAPDPVLAPRPFGALEHRSTSAPRLSVRASLAHGSSGSIGTSSGIAELTWTTVRLEVCAGLGGDDGPSAQGCGMSEIGALRGRGFRTLDPNDETVPWLAPGALARGAWTLDQLVRFELHAGAVFPARRYRFFFGPDETAHQVPAVGLTAGLGIAVILP